MTQATTPPAGTPGRGSGENTEWRSGPPPGWESGGEPGHGHGTGDSTGERSAWATGGSVFAGVMMLMYGIFAIVQGIAGIAKDDVYGSVGDYVFKFDLTSWGWIHLGVGVLLAVVGWGVLKNATWARGVGIALTCVALILNFMWLPYVPVWGLINIAVGIFVIWSLSTRKPGAAPAHH